MSSSLKIFLVFIMICFIWGSTWLGIRLSLESLTPVFSAGFRFFLASIFIYVIIRLKRIQVSLDKISLRIYLMMTLFSFTIPYGLVYWAESPEIGVPSGLAAVLFAVYPFFVFIFSFIIIRSETLGIYKLIGILTGFTGILVIFSEDLGGDFTPYAAGMAAVVFSSLMQSCAAVLIKKHGRHLNPLSMNFLPMLATGIIMLTTGFITEDFSVLRFDVNAVISVFYLAFFGSVVTFTSYYWLMKRMNVIILSLIAFITPVVALLFGWIAYGEQLYERYIWGSVLVLCGILISNAGSLFRYFKFKYSKVSV